MYYFEISEIFEYRFEKQNNLKRKTVMIKVDNF